MNKNKKLVAALTAGVALGVVAGILLAPEKGSKTRKKLTAGLKDLLDNGKEKLTGIRENLSDMVAKTKEKHA
jgi:gas vesicle protein